jgi:hypothetical protein
MGLVASTGKIEGYSVLDSEHGATNILVSVDVGTAR